MKDDIVPYLRRMAESQRLSNPSINGAGQVPDEAADEITRLRTVLASASATAGHDKASFNNGIRRAITWLHDRAKEMNDPHAKAVLNSAATNLGWDLEHGMPKAATAIRRAAEGEKE